MTDQNLTPQQRANKRQNEARRDLPRIPSIVISESEKQLLDELTAVYGTKKAAIIAGLKALKRSLNILDKARIATSAPKACIENVSTGEIGPKVEFVTETAAYYFVSVVGDAAVWKFSKRTMLRVIRGSRAKAVHKLTFQHVLKQIDTSA